jgi:DNA-binding NtrC family response regulator
MQGRALVDGRRVLIVEDNFVVAAGFSNVMVEHGGTVVGPVGSVDAALKIIREQTLDGVLLDAQLSDGNCAQVAAALIERHIPFVVVTGHQRSMLPNGLRRAPFLGKPTGTEELLEVARKTFGPASASAS